MLSDSEYTDSYCTDTEDIDTEETESDLIDTEETESDLIDTEEIDTEDEREIGNLIINHIKNNMPQSYPSHISKKLKLERDKIDKMNKVVDNEGKNLVDKILLSDLPTNVKAVAVKKIENSVSSSDRDKVISWGNTVLSLPLSVTKTLPKCNLNNFLMESRKILDETVFGMGSVKEEIIDFLVNFMNKGSSSGCILGLQSSPGLGKTRICLALSKILKLPLAKISLGGISDASILVGHDSTYIGSKAGTIVQEIKKAGCMNFILCLDEIDKVSTEKTGVYGVLTHLLDETQNFDFRDNYLDGIPIDMSKVLFITTMNDTSLIDPIVLNRIKVINIPGLMLSEKVAIVKNYIIPEFSKEYKISILFTDSLIEYIISRKTKQESGMRLVRQNISTIFRRINTIHSLRNCVDNRKIKLGFSYNDIILEYSGRNNILVSKHIVDTLIKSDNDSSSWMSMYI